MAVAEIKIEDGYQSIKIKSGTISSNSADLKHKSQSRIACALSRDSLVLGLSYSYSAWPFAKRSFDAERSRGGEWGKNGNEHSRIILHVAHLQGQREGLHKCHWPIQRPRCLCICAKICRGIRMGISEHHHQASEWHNPFVA